MKCIESLKAIRKRNSNLMISNTKLDSNFPTGQILINGYSEPFKIDRNSQEGDIMLYVREDVPSKLLGVEKSATEGFYVEINLRKKK